MIFLYTFVYGIIFKLIYNLNLKKYIYFFSALNFFLIFAYLLVNQITGKGFTRSFWFHLDTNLQTGTYQPYLFFLLLNIFICLSFFITGILLCRKYLYFLKLKKKNILVLFFLIFTLNPTIISLSLSYLDWIGFFEKKKNIIFSEYYNNIENLKNTLENRDIIFISTESFERSFYKSNINKIIDLKLLNRNDILDFSNVKEIDGYTDWTIAGLVASNCGLPITYSNNNLNNFYPSSNCLSDLLKKQGYDLSLIQGSSLKFAGNGNFYNIHGVDDLYGKNEIKKILSSKYLEYSHWGLHDNQIFDFALQHIKNNESNYRPYAIWLNTLDMHAPSGLLSNKCKEISKKIKNKMLKVANCTDIFLMKFINNIFLEDKNKNNLIVLYSDHLLMNSPFSNKYFKNSKERRNLFLIIDPYKIKNKKIIHESGNHFDIPATLIHYIGGQDKIGLGKSLLNKKSINNNISNSISESNTDHYILKSISKDLEKLSSNIILNNAFLDYEKNLLRLPNNFEFNLPIVFFDKKIILPSTNTEGNSRENLQQIILKNQKHLINSNETKIVSNCSEVNKVFNIKSECKFAFLKIKNEKNMYKLHFQALNKQNPYLLDNQFTKYNYTISNKELKNKINDLEKYKIPWYITSGKFFKKKIKHKLENLSPNFYNSVIRFYRTTKYLIIKIKLKYINNLSNLNFKKNDVNFKNFIAHAGGMIDGFKYTNSLEALNLSYKKGVRLLELDLRLTSDNKLVAVHDWKHWKKITNYKKNIPPTEEEFLSQKIYNKYTPLNLDKIIYWFENHQDATLITDKFDDINRLEESFGQISSVISEIYSENYLNLALSKKIPSILISDKLLKKNNYSVDYLYSLLKKENKPYGFSVSRYSIYNHHKFFKKAKSLGIKIYVYRLNDGYAGGTEKELLCNFGDYLDAVYADNIPELTNNFNFCD